MTLEYLAPLCGPPKPKAASRRPLVEAMGPASALGELLAASRLVQADLLAVDLARSAGHEAGLGECRLQLSVVIHQRAGDAVPNRAGLTGFTAAANVDHDVECRLVVSQLKGLPHHHAAGLTSKELVDGFFVDHELSRALLDEHTGDRALSTPGSVVIVADHGLSLKIECFCLLCGVRVLGSVVAFYLLQHGVAQRTLRQHAFHRLLQRAARKSLLHLRE